MPATSWTEASVDATGWDKNTYLNGPPSAFVEIMGVVIPVDSDGNPLTLVGAASWTEATATASTWTESSQSATSWTEAGD